MNIVENHEHQSKSKYPTLVRVPPDLQEIILNAKKDNVSIHVVRIIVSILARIKFRQIDKKQNEQLSLFEEQFFQEAESYVKFKFNYKDFMPDNYTSIKPIKEALDFLQNYKNEYHTFINKKKEKLEISGGIIMGQSFNLTAKYVTFHMNSFWYHKFVNLSYNFNEHLVHLFFKTKSINTCIFYSWLTTFPEKKTTCFIDTINKKFSTKYESYSELERSLFKGIKYDLDNNSDISFNYSKDSKNSKKVNIVGYLTNNQIDSKNANKVKDIEYSRIKRKTHYLQNKHGLTNIQTKLIKSVFQNHGFEKINYVVNKNKKTWTKNVRGEDFINLFRESYTIYLKIFEQSSKEF